MKTSKQAIILWFASMAALAFLILLFQHRERAEALAAVPVISLFVASWLSEAHEGYQNWKDKRERRKVEALLKGNR